MTREPEHLPQRPRDSQGSPPWRAAGPTTRSGGPLSGLGRESYPESSFQNPRRRQPDSCSPLLLSPTPSVSMSSWPLRSLVPHQGPHPRAPHLTPISYTFPQARAGSWWTVSPALGKASWGSYGSSLCNPGRKTGHWSPRLWPAHLGPPRTQPSSLLCPFSPCSRPMDGTLGLTL